MSLAVNPRNFLEYKLPDRQREGLTSTTSRSGENYVTRTAADTSLPTLSISDVSLDTVLPLSTWEMNIMVKYQNT